MRNEQSGDANETEKVAMRSVLGALGYLARESRPDLSEPVSILQSRLNRAQVSDIQETNRVVRLAKAHTDLALHVCRILVDQTCLVSYGDASGAGIRAEQAGYVIMFADMSLLAGLAFPVTLVSCETTCRQCLCSGAMGLSEAIAQGDWEGAFWNETIGPSEDRRSAIDLAIIREDLSRPQMFLRWVDGKAQVADALTKLHGDRDLLRAVCRQAFTVLVEPPEIMAARRQERGERERVPRAKSPLKLRELVDETSILVTPMPTVT